MFIHDVLYQYQSKRCRRYATSVGGLQVAYDFAPQAGVGGLLGASGTWGAFDETVLGKRAQVRGG